MGTPERVKSYVKCLVLVFVILSDVECGRSGGGSRSWGGGSRSSRPSSSWSRPSPSYSHPSPSRPSPSYSHPSPSYSHPSPSYSHPSPASLSYPSHVQTASRPSPSPSHTVSHPSPSPSRPIGFENVKPLGSSSSGTSGSHSPPLGPPNYGFKPSVTQGSSHGSHPPSYGFKPSATQEHATNTKPLGTASIGPAGSSAAKPPPYGFKPSAPVGPPTNVKPVGNAPPGAPYPIQPPPYTPHNPGIPPPAYNPAHNPAGYGPPPAYNPSYNPAGYGHSPAYNPGYGHASYPQQPHQAGGYGYPNQQHYPGSPGGVTNININNINTNNNHHYGGGYGGYGSGFGYHYSSYPSYHYSSGDTGSGTLGFFLGYSLAKITTPTYHYHSSSFNSGYSPRYDHYEVHHYYHNRDSIPAQSTIEPNAIVGCIGDSGTICPTGTTSLCTNNGAILCVASASSTVPCSDQKQGNCVKTTIPCVNGTGNCEVGTNKTVTIPCISSAKVPGNITYINNTIIVNKTTIINNNFNGTTNGTVGISNSSTVGSESSVHNGTVPQMLLAESALSALNNMTDATTRSTEISITLSPNITTDGTRTRRDTAVPVAVMNEFCVTILALPAERKPTEQETVLTKGTSIFSKFLVKALGAD